MSHFVLSQLKIYIEKFKITEGSLFITHYRKPITTNTVDKFLAKIKKELDIKISISSHKWRHSCATYSLANGGFVEEVQKMLGHRNFKITNKYVHVKNELVKDMVDRSSPVKNCI